MNQTILHWNYRNLQKIPEEILIDYPNVQEIYLKDNFISIISNWLFDCINLTFLQLAGNRIESIPEEIYLLVNLEFLDVSRNKIQALPDTIKFLKNLTTLNVSDNQITELTNQIGYVESLQIIDISKNLLRQLPLELANCYSLRELLINYNPLIEIPNRIMMLPALEVIEAEGCAFDYLPYVFSKSLIHVKIFNNTKLTHFPIIYDKFLKLHYDYWSENVVSADLMMIFLADENKRTVLPRGMRIIHCNQTRNPCRLIELGLRSLYSNLNYYNTICKYMCYGMLPYNIIQQIFYGPTSLCGFCIKPIFMESYFLLLKKSSNSSQILYSNMFCSKDCQDQWMDNNKNTFHSIKYTCFI